MDFYLQLGVETMSPHMAEVMAKTKNGQRYVDRARSVLAQANDLGVFTLANVLVNHPGETPETLESTVGFLERLITEHPRTSLSLAAARYSYFPGSDVERMRSSYERRFGTLIRSPEWWKAAEPQAGLSQAVQASRELTDSTAWYERLVRLRVEAVERWTADSKLIAYRRRRLL